jgi:hypothetical protein
MFHYLLCRTLVQFEGLSISALRHNTTSVTCIVLFLDAAAAVPGHVPPDCGQPGDLHGRHAQRLLGLLENPQEI